MSDQEQHGCEGLPATETRSYRAITARAAIGYLENLGGEQTGDRTVEGPGWRVALTQQKATVGSTMKLNEVIAEFAATDEETLETVVEQFSQKAIRAGG